MENKETKAQEAYRLLKDIPEDQWLTARFSNGIDKCCGVGHLKRLKSKNPSDYSINNCCDLLIFDDSNFRFHNECNLMYVDGNLASINNGETLKYQQPTPKQRVMAFLEDAIRLGY